MDTDLSTLSYKLAFAMLIIFILMILFFYIMKRLKGRTFQVKRYPLMKNLSTLSLGPRRSLALIEVCDQWLLVGVGADNISLISKIDKPSDYDQPDKTSPEEGNIFESLLKKAGRKLNTPDKSSENK